MKKGFRKIELGLWVIPIVIAVVRAISFFVTIEAGSMPFYAQQASILALGLFYLPQFKINQQWMGLIFLCLLPIGRIFTLEFWPLWYYLRTVGLFGYAFVGALLFILPKGEKQQNSMLYYGFAAALILHFVVQLFYALDFNATQYLYLAIALGATLVLRQKLYASSLERAQMAFIAVDAIAMSIPVIFGLFS